MKKCMIVLALIALMSCVNNTQTPEPAKGDHGAVAYRNMVITPVE